jgi:DNA-binding NtrC family response regulator
MIERILLLDDGEIIEAKLLPAFVSGENATSERLMVLPAAGLSLDELERELICQALERTAGNKTGAARLLGLTRDTFRYRLEKYGQVL